MANEKVYNVITEQILKALDAGIVPWRKEWTTLSPKSLGSKKAYRGINSLLLSICNTYSSQYWVTYNQAKALGGNVRKGEKGRAIVFWKWLEKTQDGETKRFPLLRYYTVFNVEQCEGIDSKVPVVEIREHSPIQDAQAIVDNMPNRPEISHGGDRAFYRPSTDDVTLPAPELFASAESYYSTAFHELAHSTGHKSRLDREFGGADMIGYSKEELIAEMSAAFLCGTCGISNATIENSAAYIQGWRKRISDDPSLVVQAAAKAQKVADYILAVDQETGDDTEE